MADLGLARSELAEDLCDGAGLYTAAQELIQTGRASAQLHHRLALLKEGAGRLETQVDNLLRRVDDLVNLVLAQPLHVD